QSALGPGTPGSGHAIAQAVEEAARLLDAHVGGVLGYVLDRRVRREIVERDRLEREPLVPRAGRRGVELLVDDDDGCPGFRDARHPRGGRTLMGMGRDATDR